MLRCDQIRRRFQGPGGALTALEDVTFAADRGELVVIQGPSGSGKTTLLLTLGGLLRPDAGTMQVDDQDLYALSTAARSRFRARTIGFVFQLFHLVPYLSVLDNVLAGLPGSVDGAARRRTAALLEELGLTARLAHRPATLSAGERQRTALARALVKEPAVILADEPTGNLDPENAALVFRRLDAFRREGGVVVAVTHGQDAAPHATRTLRLERGRLAGSLPLSR
ncbi:MAG: ABC transporter ATP-binding protein [Verrucomicrobia bacterium]|nr:ABC transporter ATP-binding protein [Verrucomicrobiota bacterium]